MPTPSRTRARPIFVTSLVAVVASSTVMIASASAATSDRDGTPDGRDVEVVDTTGLVNGP